MVNLCLHNYPELLGVAYKPPADKTFAPVDPPPPAQVEEVTEQPLTAAEALALLEGRHDK